MSHMVASPCGYEFREAMTCQRNAGEEAEQGVCAEQFVNFMECVMKTKCFKSKNYIFFSLI
jgi:intermembrane space import and assembly protein 40